MFGSGKLATALSNSRHFSFSSGLEDLSIMLIIEQKSVSTNQRHNNRTYALGHIMEVNAAYITVRKALLKN